jgi:hypothetical protein
MTGETLQLHRVIEQPTVPVLFLLDLAGIVLPRGVKLPDFGNPLDRFLDGKGEVRVVRDQLGQIVSLGRTEAQGAPDVLDGGTRFQGPESDDLSD